MNYYFAPMEGITGYLYRNAHHTFFNTIDKYFTPFIVANQNSNLRTREINDILPEHNEGLHIVPQILSNNPKEFLYTARKIKELGYEEINLNLGCPSATVVSKNKGSGFLARRDELDCFFEEIFAEPVAKISVKTRIGKDHPEEFYELIEIFNKYPIEELIIHPRIQKDFYKNKPNLEIFKDALHLSKNPVCYNGDLFTVEDVKNFTARFPDVNTIMIGRGLLTNPGFISKILYDTKLEKNLLKDFHDNIYEAYKTILFGDRNVLFKMKELWTYMICVFSNHEKYGKKIKKSEKLCDYDKVILSLFDEQELLY